jgi:hypothetical protein
MSPPPKLSRRTMTMGGIAGAAAAVVAGAIYEVPKLLRHRASGEHADLVNRLEDPEKAAVLGRWLQQNAPGRSDIAGPSLEELAAKDLKKRVANRPLQELMVKDAADTSRLVEADGWVIPLVLAEFCILAAQAV